MSTTNREARSAFSVCLLGLAAALAVPSALQAGTVDLQLVRTTPAAVMPGQAVRVELRAVSNTGASVYMTSGDMLFSWDPNTLRFDGLDPNGAVPATLSTLPFPSPGGVNEAALPADGDGLYRHIAAYNGGVGGFVTTVPPPPGVLLTTLTFTAQQPGLATPVGLLVSAGSPPTSTVVFGPGFPAPNITGALGPPVTTDVLGATLTLTASATELEPNQPVAVCIDVTSVASIISGQFELDYDPNQLQYVSTTALSPWNVLLGPVVDTVQGTISFGSLSFSGGATTGQMACVNFLALGPACDTAGLVSFAAPAPPQETALLDSGSNAYTQTAGNLTLSNLGPLTILGCTIAADAAVCPDSTGHTASVPTQPGVSYVWTVSGNATLTGGQGTSAITYDALGPGTATIDVTVTLGSCTCADTFIVSVEDSEPPVATCPADITQTADPSECGAVVTFASSVTDNCPGATITCVPASGSFFPVGTTTVTCTATDGAGNQDVCTFTVTVTDDEEPVSLCPADVTQTADPNACGAIVSFTADVTDNCAGATVACAPASGSFFPVGATTVTCTATDAAGNSAICTFSVTITDDEDPVALCPADITQSADPNACGAAVTFTADVTDNCPGATVACAPASGSFFPVGVTTVTCTATDTAGNIATCTFTVTITDDEDPVALCPAAITQTADPGACGAVVSFTADVTDNCPGATAACVPASGSIFPVGTTTVTCTATDAAGNAAACTFTVTITDNEAPVALCPADITQTADPDECGAVVSFTADVTDNCPGATVDCVPASGAIFPVGTTTVTCTATDAAGNTGACTFTVTVTDDQAPVVQCPADITQAADAGVCGAVVTFAAGVTDNCPGATVICAPASGSFFDVGTTTVTCTATDAAGNTATCTFTITVTDNEAPVANCPADITQSVDAGQCGAIVAFAATATDNCPGASVACAPPSGSFFPVGATTVTCTATDAAGNTGSCSFTVTVTDDEPPVATCPADITQAADAGGCDAVISFTATVSDNCPGATIACAPPSGSAFPVGTTTVTCTATDAAGNTSTCSFDVTVNDGEPPVATCPADITQSVDAGLCGAIITFSASASDNCPGATVACAPPSGSLFPVGVTTVTCTATDAAGNTGVCSFTVTIIDNEPPVATCPADITQSAAAGQCGAMVDFTATASDNCPGATVTCAPPSGSFFPVGATTVTCTATDAAGNTATCTFTVTVTDDEPPVATCPADVTQSADAGLCAAVVSFVATVTDNCPNATVMCSPPSGATFPAGSTTVTCTATDAAGNTDTCSFTVTVTDDEPPVATCPADITQPADPGECGASITFAATATDNCPGVAVTCSPPSGTLFPIGTTTVTCTATDGAGNQDVCTFSVTVTDASAPVAQCPADITQAADSGMCGAVVTFTADASDNCPGATVICSPASGSFFDIGPTTVTCTATDAAGNVDTCTFTVTITDDEPPLAQCPADITVPADPNQAGATVTFTSDAYDNCVGATIACDPPSGSFFPIGTTTVTCTATDLTGNTDVCTFTVTVLETEATLLGHVELGFSGAPFPDVELTALTAGTSAVTDTDGNYALLVPAGAAETVEPCKSGWLFTPPQRSYTNPVGDISGQDYSGRHLYDIDMVPDGDGLVGPGDLSYFATSWNQTVPPAQARHDFDCTGVVDSGDLSFFATAWLKSVLNPAIVVPPCHICPAEAGTASGPPQAALAVVAVADVTRSEYASALPHSLAEVSLGTTYFVEVWARDTSVPRGGLTGVYVNVAWDPGQVDLQVVTAATAWELFRVGDASIPGVAHVGGATLAPAIAAEEWVRVGVFQVTATQAGRARFALSAAAEGVAVFGRGLVPDEALDAAGTAVLQRALTEPFDVRPRLHGTAAER